MSGLKLSGLAVLIGCGLFWLMLGDFALSVLWFVCLIGVLWMLFAGMYGVFRAVRAKGWLIYMVKPGKGE